MESESGSLYSIFIINKAGGLIFHRDLLKRKVRLSSNNYLQIAGVFHGMYAIASQLAPTRQVSSGLISFESDDMRLRCFQSVTGTKFVVTCSLDQTESALDSFLSRLYELYADYVLKNPFYDLEQPIHNCEKFQIHLKTLIDQSFH